MRERPALPSKAGTERILAWRDGACREIDQRDLRQAHEESGTRLWVDLTSPSDDRVRELADMLHIHPLVAEDIAERNQRAKFEDVDDLLHIVLFALRHEHDAVIPSEIDMVLGKELLLTTHAEDFDPFALSQLKSGIDAILGHGLDKMLWAISDGIVDGYFPVFDALAEELDQIQDDVITNATPTTLMRCFSLKRELLNVRRAVTPAREVFNELTNRDLPYIAPEHVVYFRDIYDHLVRVTEELDNDRELVAGTIDVYLSTVNNNLGIIVKRLTGVTVVVAGVAALAGIFGMSEAGSAFNGTEAIGFWLVTAAIVLLAALATLFLRRIDWI